MRKNLSVVILLLLLGIISFFILDLNKSTGFAVSNESAGINGTNATGTTKQDALNAINESKKAIQIMHENNFSITHLNDLLIEAEQIFQQAEYAEILRGEVNSTAVERQIAESSMRLIQWQDITYGTVLNYTNEILNHESSAFWISDEINADSKKINSSSNAAISIFEQAKIAFFDERYNDAEKLLEDFQIQIEKDKSQSSVFTGIKIGAMNFFQRYWIEIIIFLLLLSAIGYHLYNVTEKRVLNNKIKKMRAQEQSLNELVKKTEIERFKENKISGLVYNIRMKKYEEKLHEIKEKIPVLEERLKKLSKRIWSSKRSSNKIYKHNKAD